MYHHSCHQLVLVIDGQKLGVVVMSYLGNMKADINLLKAVELAIEDGKLEPSEWESDFLDSIRDWVDSNRTLTRKQRETLDRIHERIRAW